MRNAAVVGASAKFARVNESGMEGNGL